MSNNVPENDLVWLNNVSVHDELDFGGKISRQLYDRF